MLGLFVFRFRWVEVAVVKNPDALKFAFFIQIVEHNLVHDFDIALFPLDG